jgi:hypothetical protein
MLEAFAAQLGFGSCVGRFWEAEWGDELDDLWPAIEAVAAMLVSGETVTTAIVSELVEQCSAPEADW